LLTQTIKSILESTAKLLTPATDSPALDAELLLMHTLQVQRSYLHAWPDRQLSAEQLGQYQTFVTRRARGEPVAYITGVKEFWSLPLHVTTDTLIPRPETELLVELILSHFSKKNKVTVVDLGTGSGAIALALAHEKPEWEIYATDKSQQALDVAMVNAKQLQLTNINFVYGEWFLPLTGKMFDVVVSNPPYISHEEWQEYEDGLKFEPSSALLSERDGIADIEQIIRQATSYLASKGLLIIEHGYQQAEQVRHMFVSSGYKDVETVCDLASQDRVTLGFTL
jgi:release factor glutamine methyltransferase